MKQPILIITFNFLLIATSAAIAESKQAENTPFIVPEGSTDYKKGYLDGFVKGVKQSDQEGLENHKKRLAKAEAKLHQAVEDARKNLSK